MADQRTVFIEADKALQNVVNQIQPDQWDADASVIQHWGEQKVTLRQLIQGHVSDDLWVPDILAGKTIAEVGDKYAGDLLGADPVSSFANAVKAAVACVAALTDKDLYTTVHLSYGDFTVREYLEHITTFRGFRAYTIAKFIDVDTTLPAELVDGLWDEVVPNIDYWRTMGVFGPAVDVPEGADKQTKLLGLTGFWQD